MMGVNCKFLIKQTVALRNGGILGIASPQLSVFTKDADNDAM